MKKSRKAVDISGSEPIYSFKEREKRSIELNKKIQEAYPMVGGAGEDSLWRSLTSNTQRDLNLLTQRRMQDIAFYLYDSNPMAKRIIEIIKDFVVGDGFTYSVRDKNVKEVIDDFWNDYDNNLDSEIEVNVTELAIFGELCLPVWVNPANGAVKLGYIDPKFISKITKDKTNPKINRELTWKMPGDDKDETVLNIIGLDKKVKNKTYGYLMGDCFYFTINKVSSASRGRSDLLNLADWLDSYDQFLFARLERAFLLNNYIWDITCEGMDKAELIEFVKGIAMPKPGSIRAHNEKVTWKAETPRLESSDASAEASLFKNQILGGAGFPEHWFAEGSRTTRATATEMALPTLKKLKSRQRVIKFQLEHILNFVIDQAIVHGRLPKDVDKTFKIIPSPIVSRDNKGTMESVNSLIDALIKAKDKNWISDKDAKDVITSVISQIGIEFDNNVEEDTDTTEEEDSNNNNNNNNNNIINKKKKDIEDDVKKKVVNRKDGIGDE